MDAWTLIRPATADDCHGLWQLRAEAIRHGARDHYTQKQIEAWVARRTPQSYLVPRVLARILVAECGDGSLTGFAQLHLEKGEVEAIYVHPAFTRQGVGTRLLAELEARARSAGLQQLRLDAALNAVPFYERTGFRRERKITYPLEGGGEYACVVMTKQLQ